MNTDAKPVRLADGDELDAFVADHDLALVEFYTKGCTLCQAMEPVLGNVARAMSAERPSGREHSAGVGMVNPETDISLVDRFDIRSVPTLLLFRDGEVVARKAEGVRGASAVIDFLDEHAPSVALSH